MKTPHRLISLTILSVACLLASACSGHSAHAWQLEGDDNTIQVDTSRWVVLPNSRWEWVHPDHLELPVRMLASRSFLPISSDKALELCPHARKKPYADLTPYLVRGVSWGRYPIAAIVKLNPRTRQLLVYQASFHAENVFVRLCMRSVPTPLVVWLSGPPSEVLVTAECGGDGMLGKARTIGR